MQHETKLVITITAAVLAVLGAMAFHAQNVHAQTKEK